MNNASSHSNKTPNNHSTKNASYGTTNDADIRCSSSIYSAKSWLWLIFSLYYFVPIYYQSFSTLELLLLVGIFSAFVGLYLWAITLAATRVWQALGSLTLLTLLTCIYTPGASTFFAYIGFLIGFSYRAKIWLNLVLVLSLLIILVHYHFAYPVPFFALPALSGLITVSVIGYVERLRLDARINQQKSREEIEQLAVIAERERIARDLHDILGHTLSSIVLKAELAEKLLGQQKSEQAQLQLSDLHQIARHALSLVRQTVSGYKHRGLSGEVMELCNKLRQGGFITVLNGDIPHLSARAETALILALTELTTNVLRHSDGTHCQIEFRQTGDWILVSMRDNGTAKSLTPGNGIQGIQERLDNLAGELKFSFDHGCEFIIALPRRELQQ